MTESEPPHLAAGAVHRLIWRPTGCDYGRYVTGEEWFVAGRFKNVITSTQGTCAMTGPIAHQPVLDLIVLDCPDALELARFYSGLLGWPIEDGAQREWAMLKPPGGGVSPDNPDGHPTLAFQRIEDWVSPTWPGGAHPQQFHLDFAVGDLDAAEPNVLSLGATRHAHQPSKDGGFRVYLDPAGHPFCLIR